MTTWGPRRVSFAARVPAEPRNAADRPDHPILILGAVYLFLVKPILDTTDKAFEGFGSIDDSISNAFDDVGIDPPDLSGSSKTDAERILDCVKRVEPDTSKMRRCAERFGR